MVKNPAANTGDARDASSVPGWGRSPGEENGNHSSILACNIHGHRNLVGYSPWGHKESDTTEHTHTQGGQEDQSLLLIHRSTEPSQCQLFPMITPLGSRADRT